MEDDITNEMVLKESKGELKVSDLPIRNISNAVGNKPGGCLYNFPLPTLRKMLIESGAKKISGQAVKEFHRQLTKKAEALIMRSKTISKIRGRQEVSGSDIRTAMRELYIRRKQ